MAKLSQWINTRFPLKEIWVKHVAQYYAPKNFNIWYVFGSITLVILLNQLITGLWLTMFYTPTSEGAFASVESIMRDVRLGWLLRYLHSTGASAFFIAVYCHMFRGLMYGSYKKPRELLWLIGMLIYVMLLMEAFMGYLLPWGQMSYWGAEVITSLFGAIPWIGEPLLTWIRGDYSVSGVTLNRFFAFHVVGIPLLLLFLVWMHLIALHRVGSNNPDGVEIKDHLDSRGHPLDGIPFHPYYTIKDLWAVSIFLIVFFFVVFFIPEMFGLFLEPTNFTPADPLQTPTHIAPVWYMTPFYAILRAIPNKLLGVTLMFSSIIVLFFIPWLDRSRVKSIRYRGWFSKIALGVFSISFICLGYLGLQEISPLRVFMARIFAVLYFSFFIFMPFYTRFEKTQRVPDRVTYP